MNPLDPRVAEGTVGELLVVLRLLEHGVQASFTLKDSGNDLLAASPQVIRAIQVKSTVSERWNRLPTRERTYHILALVRLVGGDTHVELDKCKIYLLTKDQVNGRSTLTEKDVGDFSLEDKVTELFSARDSDLS